MKKTTNWQGEYVVIEPSTKEIKELESGFSIGNNLDLNKILANSKRKTEPSISMVTAK